VGRESGIGPAQLTCPNTDTDQSDQSVPVFFAPLFLEGPSCAELAIVHHLRGEGWHGVWVCAYGPRELRSEWFPAPAVKIIAQTGAPLWAVEIFDRLRAANGGKLDGFFDVFAWREPGEVGFDEAKTATPNADSARLAAGR
jgi:hypothetical protein